MMALGLSGSIFDNRPLYSRAAPSPPARKKPPPRINDPSPETKQFVETGRGLAQTGILDSVPVPPRRKLSPRMSEVAGNAAATDGNTKNNVEDLIKF